MATKSRKKPSKVANPEEIYYALPYDEVQPIFLELKDTVECLTEMGESHRWGRGERELAGHRRSRRAA